MKQERKTKRWLVCLCAALMLTACVKSKTDIPTPEIAESSVPSNKYEAYAAMSPEEICSSLTLEQKAAQMVLPAVYQVDEKKMRKNDYGGILSKAESVHYDEWQKIVGGFQKAAIESDSGIPYLYGQDDVHGVNYCAGAVIFPHNINMGAANDPDLMYQVGLATADEARLCHMLWNYAPCLAQSVDPRWGRTYESYGSDLEIIGSLGTAYTKGLIDGGVVACAKHFFADGNVLCGTGEKSDIARLIDRGDARLSDKEIGDLLSVYQAQIDAGVQTIMLSHSSLNGQKMHENGEYIGKLKEEMGFDGFIVSDWDSVKNTSPKSYKEQVITAVNAGIDMLMEVGTYDEAMQIIIDAVHSGEIAAERVDDAVTRILRVKQKAGLFEDPMMEELETVQSETGSDNYRQLAEQLVEESLVLIKNENDILPIKKGTSVFVTGPACDNAKAQCGGWTLDWLGSPDGEVEGTTTILEGFRKKADAYGIHIAENMEEADVILLAVGEQSYAEWYGDMDNPHLCGKLGLPGNREAIDAARSSGKPTIACIVAGRNVIMSFKDMDAWDGLVMCYLPGTEGQGVADVLLGGSPFQGKLPAPWYNSIEGIESQEPWLPAGFGLE